MQPAGYSARPLAAKLGLKPGMRALLLDAPQGYLAALGDVASTVEWIVDVDATGLDFIQMFASERGELEARLPALVAPLAPDGALWLCWPKLASGRPTDLRETVIREIGLAAGLVDVKVAAIDAVWSGLKFVYRLRDR
jgi:hypothetical protein